MQPRQLHPIPTQNWFEKGRKKLNIRSQACCAIGEIYNLSNPLDDPEDGAEDKLWHFCQFRNSQDPVAGFYYSCRYLIFTQASPSGDGTFMTDGYGFEFAQFIQDNNLGEVIDTIPSGINPNSLNEVKVWVWIPDMAAVRNWLQAEVIRREYKYVSPPTTVGGTINITLQDSGLIANFLFQRGRPGPARGLLE